MTQIIPIVQRAAVRFTTVLIWLVRAVHEPLVRRCQLTADPSAHDRIRRLVDPITTAALTVAHQLRTRESNRVLPS